MESGSQFTKYVAVENPAQQMTQGKGRRATRAGHLQTEWAVRTQKHQDLLRTGHIKDSMYCAVEEPRIKNEGGRPLLLCPAAKMKECPHFDECKAMNPNLTKR